MSKRFRGENFWGKPEAIRELLKELGDDEEFISEDESENEDFIEVENSEFLGSINISLRNAHVIYVHNMARKSEKALSGRKFAISLNRDLLAP
ncbi:hypothetical protein TNCT_580321 [Trichonephila clavata]|uniref:Uncharacterized protein n=1 Tax=Trichonephila clavata TaxID=2740835 RepID=A0A8X6IEY7_TRICU|nr:hypothetical protein TNCT_580321 [Trichonephila clavata]